MVQQHRNVVAHRGKTHRPVLVRRATVALYLHRDYLPCLSRRLHPSLHLADRRQPTMNQHQRFALAVDLVIELDAVHISVVTAHHFHLRLSWRVDHTMLLWLGGISASVTLDEFVYRPGLFIFSSN